jgi:hypothetical protein
MPLFLATARFTLPVSSKFTFDQRMWSGLVWLKLSAARGSRELLGELTGTQSRNVSVL